MAPPTEQHLVDPGVGLRHARLIRPPRIDWDGQRYCGARLLRIDSAAARKLAGVQQVWSKQDLVAVIADSDQAARTACALVRITWSRPDPAALRTRQASTILKQGKALPDAAEGEQVNAVYQWQPAAVEGEATSVVALASLQRRGMRIDLPFGNPRAVALELSSLLGMPAQQIDVRSHRPAATDLERAHASDAAGVVALLCAEVGTPVSLVLEIAGSATWPSVLRMQAIPAGLAHYAQQSGHPSPPPLAWLLTGLPYGLGDAALATPAVLKPPYDWAGIEITHSGSTPPPAATVFAQEAFFDEVAASQGADPVQYRLDHLDDAHGAQLIRSVAQAAHWQPQRRNRSGEGNILRGRGFAYASTIDDEGGRPLQSWSAWVADVEYDRSSGELSVTRVTAGHDMRDIAAPSDLPLTIDAGRPALLNEQARLAMSQAIVADNRFDSWARTSQLAVVDGANDLQLPAIEVVGGALSPHLRDVQLKAGGAFALPAAAAIANAIHDATGVRLRTAPLSAGQITLALAAQEKPRGWRSLGKLGKLGWIGGAVTTLGATLLLAAPWRGEIAPVPRPDPTLYSAATIERGRLVALAGDCAVCHTAPNGGTVNAGGHALQTPFGTIYTTNITPDEQTGIGNWSYAAFERSMRQGIHRDGRNLYPAFPYGAFARISEADMQALYGYLMAQPAVQSTPPPNQLRFPFNMRPLLAGWNLLFHTPAVFQPDPAQSALWNRGAYLVEGAGHCSACHSPRNVMGAEKGGRDYLGGGVVDGWDAPALTARSKSPNPWTEDQLFTYLRTGFSDKHGIAAGPMAPVVAELAQLPAGDVRAMAHYLASLNRPQETAPAALPIAPTATATQVLSQANGKRLFQGACAACHQEGTGPTLFGVRPSLMVNTNIHSDTPDNLVHVILHGIREPANADLGYMPGFAASFSDAQVADLLAYLRTSFAPGKPAWTGVDASIARSRLAPSH